MLRAMLRIPRLLIRPTFVALFATLLLAPAAASAQMTQGPPIPLAVDLSKVKLGSWAKYTTTVAGAPPMAMKMALVNRSPAGHTLEMSAEGGMAVGAGAVVTQITLPTNSETASKMVLQVGSNDPMEAPVPPQKFTKPDPKKLVKAETLKVPAGSYKTKHYHDKTPEGDTVDFWVSESVAPLGLVKIEMTQKSNAMLSGPVTMELAATGKDAKMAVTKPAKPFDQNLLMKEIAAAGGGGAPAAPAAPPAK
jgi:hypothetical protein